MKDILAAENLRTLSRFMAGKPLLAFDFDGTLAPIVKDPGSAQLRSSTRRLLRDLSRRHPCAVVSGRMRGDLCKRLEGIPLIALVGNHGQEWTDDETRNPGVRRRVAAWKDRLIRELECIGVSIEDKKYSLSVHTRHDISSLDLRRRLESIPDARVVGGKDVFNILPVEASGKGEALATLMKNCGRDRAVYLGDDDTDEEAFSVSPAEKQILTIRVGYNRNSSAAYFVRSQTDVDRLLEKMLS